MFTTPFLLSCSPPSARYRWMRIRASPSMRGQYEVIRYFIIARRNLAIALIFLLLLSLHILSSLSISLSTEKVIYEKNRHTPPFILFLFCPFLSYLILPYLFLSKGKEGVGGNGKGEKEKQELRGKRKGAAPLLSLSPSLPLSLSF